jgi:hypothetical protein
MHLKRLTLPQAILAATLLILSAAQITIIFRPGWWHTHESLSYVIRTVEYLRNWDAGVFIPRWCPDFYGGYGSPFFNYYAPLFFATSALIAKLGAGVVLGIKLSIATYWSLGALGMFALSFSETKRFDAATVATAAFVTAPYRLGTIYTRGDLSEAAACCLLPWVILGVRELGRAQIKQLPHLISLTSLAFAATFVTHTITGFWTAQVTVIIIIAMSIKANNPAQKIRSIAVTVAFILGLCLGAFYLLPAFFEKQAVRTEDMMMLASNPPSQWFQPWTAYIPFSHFVLPWKKGWHGIDPRNIGLGVFLSILLFVRLAWKNRHSLRYIQYGWFIATAASLTLTTPASEPLWRLMPLWGYTQFPYRMFGFATLSGSVLLGCLWKNLLSTTSLYKVLGISALFAISSYSFVLRAGNPILTMPLDATSIIRGNEPYVTPPKAFISTTGIEEYLPRTVISIPKTPRPLVATLADNKSRIVEINDKGVWMSFVIDAEQPTTLFINVFWFPGWKIKAQKGPTPAILSPSAEGLIAVSLPTPGHYALQVSFEATRLRLAGSILSIVTLLSVILSIILPKMALKSS